MKQMVHDGLLLVSWVSNVCVFRLIMELLLSSTQIDDSPHSNAQRDRQEGQRSSLCLVGVEDRVPVDGPIRAAFIHTRLQSFGEARFRQDVHKYRLVWVSFGNCLRVQYIYKKQSKSCNMCQ